MRTTLTTAMALMLLAGASSLSAWSAETKEPLKQDIRVRKNEQDPKRPRIPSNVSIGFYYSNGVCSFTLPYGVTSISITMENADGGSFYGFATADYPVWQINLSSGEYHIICDADNGQVFEGHVYID